MKNCLSRTEHFGSDSEKYIILNEVKGRGEVSLSSLIKSWTGSFYYTYCLKMCGS